MFIRYYLQIPCSWEAEPLHRIYVILKIKKAGVRHEKKNPHC